MRVEKGKIDLVRIRLVSDGSITSSMVVNNPGDALSAISKELATMDRELFAILNLKSDGQVINLNIVSMGTLSETSVHPRECFKSSILSNASHILAIHNHPSGNIRSPSTQDIEVTKRLYEAGKILGISLVDHVIVAGETGEMYSFKEHGMMPDQDGSLIMSLVATKEKQMSM